MNRTPTIEIIPFETHHREAFKQLNLAWLEKFFNVEPIDEEILSHPEKIIQSGGHIFMARCGEGIVGTCALQKIGDGKFELSKMAVNEKFQGAGIGRRLLEAAIAQCKRYPGFELILETNSSLKQAIHLYESAGFVHATRPDGPSHYKRADVYMIYVTEKG
jgi:ribosomal protein S18 acetylase RimI-like enzyme